MVIFCPDRPVSSIYHKTDLDTSVDSMLSRQVLLLSHGQPVFRLSLDGEGSVTDPFSYPLPRGLTVSYDDRFKVWIVDEGSRT